MAEPPLPFLPCHPPPPFMLIKQLVGTGWGPETVWALACWGQWANVPGGACWCRFPQPGHTAIPSWFPKSIRSSEKTCSLLFLASCLLPSWEGMVFIPRWKPGSVNPETSGWKVLVGFWVLVCRGGAGKGRLGTCAWAVVGGHVRTGAAERVPESRSSPGGRSVPRGKAWQNNRGEF